MNPLKHPGALQLPENDVEKRGELNESVYATSSGSVVSQEHDIPPTPRLLRGRIARWNDKIEGLGGLEARGITRVLPEEKHAGGLLGYFQMFMLWFSIDVVILNGVIGLLGPVVFSLGWVDSVCIVIFANALSCCGPAYIATLSPQSGNRTMVRLWRNCQAGSARYARDGIESLTRCDCSLDSQSLFHGILALQNHLHLECHSPNGLGYHRSHRCRTTIFCC